MCRRRDLWLLHAVFQPLFVIWNLIYIIHYTRSVLSPSWVFWGKLVCFLCPVKSVTTLFNFSQNFFKWLMQIVPDNTLLRLYGSNEVICVRCKIQHLAWSNHSINGSYTCKMTSQNPRLLPKMMKTKEKSLLLSLWTYLIFIFILKKKLREK